MLVAGVLCIWYAEEVIDIIDREALIFDFSAKLPILNYSDSSSNHSGTHQEES
jgi:hypothetical protein